MSLWIALEGGEGSGKTTQARLLSDAWHAVLTREPGGTEVGSGIRALLLDPALHVEHRTEALLMAADRAQHYADVVAPALAAGRPVVSDRSAWSSLAYQGFGRGLPLDDLRRISDWSLRGRWPDLAVLIDVPAAEADARRAGRGTADRFEHEDAEFHQRVREGYAALAAESPLRWVVVDGTGPEGQVAARVADAVRART